MRAAIYCRLSEEDQHKLARTDDSESIQNQKTMLLQYAAGQGWEVYRVYSDDDYAGADRRRPAFNQLLNDARKRRFEIVLCKTQSRFTRELELVEKYIHGLFPIWGIRFVSIVDNADTANKGNKKSRQINGLVNEWYLEDMSENIRSVLTSKRQNGLHIGSFALYGYQKDPACKGHLLVDEQAAAVVRDVFVWFTQGYGKTAIARMLNDRGIPNPTEYKRLKGLRYRPPQSKNSTLWKYAAISHMLTNEIYLGNMVQGKYGSTSYKTKRNRPRPRSEWMRVEGTHEAIIDRALWDRVQDLLSQRAKPAACGAVGLFAQKVRCAQCGYIMRSTKSRGKSYLKCATHHIAKEVCEGAFVAVDCLEEAVLKELKRLTAAHLDAETLEQMVSWHDCLADRISRIQRDITVCQTQLARHTAALRQLYLDRIEGVVTDRDYEVLFKDFTSQRDRLQAALEAHQGRLDQLQSQRKTEDKHALRKQECLTPTRLTREMVCHLIDYIVVSKRISGTNEVPIEIHWRF